MSLLIKNATLANREIVNIFIKNKIIFYIGPRSPAADKSIDAKGLTAMPGVIDPHVHFRTPGMEHKEDWITGSSAALAGGVTTVLDMPNNKPSITSRKALEEKRSLIAGRSYINYGLYIGATESNIEEIKSAENIAGIKVYLASTTGDLLVSDYNIVERIMRESPHLVAFHSEDEGCLRNVLSCQPPAHTASFSLAELHNIMRPEKCAVEAASNIIEIVNRTRKKAYICHTSNLEEIELLHKAKQKGLPIYIEVAPHHLFLNQEEAERFGNLAKVNPPLRAKTSQESLKHALNQSIIDTIGSDHAPHLKEEKQGLYDQIQSGLPGIEHSLPLMLNYFLDGKINMMRIQELMSENPALIFGIRNRGFVLEGYFGDLAIVDLNLTMLVKNDKLYTKCGWSLYDGRTIQGWPVMTIVNGEIVFKDGKIIGKPQGSEVF